MVSSAPTYGQSFSRNITMFALRASFPYSEAWQVMGPRTLTASDGAPPPGHDTLSHVAIARSTELFVVAKLMPCDGQPSACTYRSTQPLNQLSGVPTFGHWVTLSTPHVSTSAKQLVARQ